MKRILSMLVLFAGFLAQAGVRPNIIIILADDLGFADLGCYGSEIETPNLDRMAKEGLRFKQFYNNARCCPTRASLLTGLYAHQAGVGLMTGERKLPGYHGELNERCITIAQALQGAGYHTGMAGKWHVSHVKLSKPQLNFASDEPFATDKDNWPMQRGFEKYYGTIHGVCSYFDPYSLVDGNTPIRAPQKNFYYTDAITDHAANFIKDFAADTKNTKPFFLYVAYTAPHWPLQAPNETIGKYANRYQGGWDQLREERRQKQIKLGLIDPAWPVAPPPTNVISWADTPNHLWEANRMAVYAAMVDRMDQGIGKIFQTLKDQHLTKDTLVLFLSDNGACAENIEPEWYDVPSMRPDGRPVYPGNNDPGQFAGTDDIWQSYGPAWAEVSNTPFRLYKHWAHEGGISAPFIAWWPGHVQGKGKITDAIGHVIDLMPTCLEAAGASYPKSFNHHELTALEGKSLLPILTQGKAQEERTLFWEHEGNKAVRSGKWKLVSQYPLDWELYDMESNRTETRDVAAEYPGKVADLKGLYEAWAKRCGVAAWPIGNPLNK